MRLCVFSLLCTIASGQTFTTLDQMYGSSGAYALAPMIQGLDGNLYGTTQGGGYACISGGCGVIYKLAPDGTLTTLYTFEPPGLGAAPQSGLTQIPNGKFYGTACSGGGLGNYGTVFEITPTGVLTTLHSFAQTDGACPIATLVRGLNGYFYGTTSSGGADDLGTVFEISAAGQFVTLHNFEGVEGANPGAGLIEATDGNFYGTTSKGGVNGAGTVFRITPKGLLTSLHSFDGTDGSNPNASLIQATDGNLYGTTSGGGSGGNGTVFQMSLSGTLNTFYAFAGGDTGSGPTGLIEATDGNFYGTTVGGGNTIHSSGIIYQLTPAAVLTVLWDFAQATGCNPKAPMVEATSGLFYGTTNHLGVGNGGSLFSLATGLGPFVSLLPAVGTAGSTVEILGTDLTSVTGVTFNGTPATFTIVSPSQVSAVVPTGASTGRVQVLAPSGDLNSTSLFRILSSEGQP
jgi:uncharacterized repeat protein (TIGR03803 family)